MNRRVLAALAATASLVVGLPAVEAAAKPVCNLLRDDANDVTPGVVSDAVPDGGYDVLSADVATHHRVKDRSGKYVTAFTGVIRLRNLSQLTGSAGYFLSAGLPGRRFGVETYLSRPPGGPLQISSVRAVDDSVAYGFDDANGRVGRAQVDEEKSVITVTVRLPFQLLNRPPVDIKPKTRMGTLRVVVTDFIRNQVPNPPKNDEASSLATYLAGSSSCVRPLSLL